MISLRGLWRELRTVPRSKAIARELERYRKLSNLLKDIRGATGKTQRTPESLERVFPEVIWGHPDRTGGPVLFTFDDGPDPESTPALLDVLDRHKTKAVFFVKGERLPSQAELLKRMRKARHHIGYHGLSHKAWWGLGGTMRDVEMNPETLPLPQEERTLSDKPFLLRPPFGRFDPAVLTTTKRLGATLMLWRLVVGDWHKGLDADSLIDRLLNTIKSGDIVVLHDGGKNGSLLPRVLDAVLPLLPMRGITVGKPKDFLGN